MNSLTEDTITAIILGHAIGDALGVPVEFCDRSALIQNPVTDFRAFGTHHMPAGTWSDDTSMTLAAMDSLCHGLDYEDMMRRFCAWEKENAYTATGKVFDMGISTADALHRCSSGAMALKCGCTGEYDNGNGSLMRILPAVLYCKVRFGNIPKEESIEVLHNVSALTHAHPRSMIGCGIYGIILDAILDHPDKAAVADGLRNAKSYYKVHPEYADELKHYSRLFEPHFAELPPESIGSSGYVVSSLEAAVWCVLTTNSYPDAVLKAVNLGSDTDTVAAIAGGLAGAIYGIDGIPQKWVHGLLKSTDITDLCKNFYQALSL